MDFERRVEQLEAAIREHRSQRADDRCWLDDDKLYEALGDGIKCDRRVGDKEAMLANCRRFIENRCEAGGPWKSYTELEAELAAANDKLVALRDSHISERTQLVHRALYDQVTSELQAEIDRLSSLLFGARCIYCEELLFADRKNQEIADEELRNHIAQCKKHPLPKVTADRDRLAAELNSAQTEMGQMERWIRERIWASHGCEGIYGDDGEMQCNNLDRHGKTLDFKRMELREVFEVDIRCRMERAANLALQKETS